MKELNSLMIYLIGVVISYYLGRYFGRKILKDDYGYQDVLLIFVSSLASFASVAAILLTYFYFVIEEKFENKKPNKFL